MKRILLITVTVLVVLTVGVFWLTRERADSVVQNLSTTQREGRRAISASPPLTADRIGTPSPAARPQETSVARIVPRAADGGERANAVVRVGTRESSLQANSLGLFPRVSIGLEETVRVAVSYPDGQPGDLVVIQSEDGGQLDSGQIVMQATLNNVRQVQFSFTSTTEGGLYRVCLRKGFNEKRLEFWGSTQTAKQ